MIQLQTQRPFSLWYAESRKENSLTDQRKIMGKLWEMFLLLENQKFVTLKC